MIYSLFIQIIGFVPSLISIISIQLEDRKKILILQLFCAIMWLTHYYLLGAYTAVLTNCIGIMRSVISYYNDKNWAKSNIWLFIIILLSLLSSLVSWSGFISILPSLSMVLTATGLWIKNLKITRVLFLLSSPCLLLYDIKTGSWGCTIIEIVAFFSFLFAILRLDILPNIKRRENVC